MHMQQVYCMELVARIEVVVSLNSIRASRGEGASDQGEGLFCRKSIEMYTEVKKPP